MSTFIFVHIFWIERLEFEQICNISTVVWVHLVHHSSSVTVVTPLYIKLKAYQMSNAMLNISQSGDEYVTELVVDQHIWTEPEISHVGCYSIRVVDLTDPVSTRVLIHCNEITHNLLLVSYLGTFTFHLC